MSLSFPPTVHFALGRSTARTSSACTASRFAVPQFQPGAGPKSSAQSWTWQVGQLRQMLSILETTSLTFLNLKLYFFLISFVLQEVVNAGSPCRSLTSSALVAVIDVENKSIPGHRRLWPGMSTHHGSKAGALAANKVRKPLFRFGCSGSMLHRRRRTDAVISLPQTWIVDTI